MPLENCEFTDNISVHKHAKNNLANIQPSWPLCLANNPFYYLPQNTQSTKKNNSFIENLFW